MLGGGPQPELQLSHRLGGTQGKPLCSLASVSLHMERNWDPIGDFLVLFLEALWPHLGPRSLLELSLPVPGAQPWASVFPSQDIISAPPFLPAQMQVPRNDRKRCWGQR